MEQQHAMNRNEERSTERENGIAIENVIRQVSLITRERGERELDYGTENCKIRRRCIGEETEGEIIYFKM